MVKLKTNKTLTKRKKKLKAIITIKRDEYKIIITITIMTIMYLSEKEREINEEEKKSH